MSLFTVLLLLFIATVIVNIDLQNDVATTRLQACTPDHRKISCAAWMTYA